HGGCREKLPPQRARRCAKGPPQNKRSLACGSGCARDDSATAAQARRLCVQIKNTLQRKGRKGALRKAAAEQRWIKTKGPSTPPRLCVQKKGQIPRPSTSLSQDDTSELASVGGVTVLRLYKCYF